MTDRPLGSVWRSGRVWHVQMPAGIQTVDTKREADALAEGCALPERDPSDKSK